ncbi:MAG: class I SAM-dependent methyltransferase [Treponema sp.]|jgi:adenine-specific DNA methylase|nr:class I SAM-dependent methyltransferase [Treponema sp.]
MRLIEKASSEKLRGGYYTPAPIASFLLKWGLNGKADCDILEPSCGDGIFLKQIHKEKLPYRSITAIELDPMEAKKAAMISFQNVDIKIMDFHRFCNTIFTKYDLVIGNPPYIRYQYFDRIQQEDAKKIYERAGLTYTKLSNAWVSFVVGASLLLKEKSKIAFVLPAEFLQVSYAHGLRKYLSAYFNKINIISFQELVFPEIQQEVILLLCEKNNDVSHTIEHIEINNLDGLRELATNRLKANGKKIDFINNKWTYYFLEQNEIDFLEKIYSNESFSVIGDYANVEVGITTGANDYFTVPYSIVKEYGLQRYAKPMVGRSVQVPSVCFTKEDWLNNRNSKIKSNILVFPPAYKLADNEGVLRYIQYGESLGVNKGYKTGIRDDWFVIPSVKLSDALFIRRNNIHAKLILNKANVYTTDTMHRVFIKDGINKNAFIASYYNSVSFAFSEIEGRSYGGGVLELMPSETESIFLPYKEENRGLMTEIDKMMRNKTDIDNILRTTNRIILQESFGLSVKEIKLANTIWKKLSSRRLNRSTK